MAHDDRLFTLVCFAALLITGAVFIWTHHGSIRFEVGSLAEPSFDCEPAATTTSRTDHVPAVGVAHAHVTDDTSSVVPAVFELPPVSPDSLDGSTSDQLLGIVEAIIEHRTPMLEQWKLPALSEILVRKDSDGRLVVAPGTHRRYNGVREAITVLDGPSVASAWAVLENRYATGLPGDPVLLVKVLEALDLLLAPEVPNVELDMISRGSYWGFVDPGLDDLSPAQKHMLLMGIDNQRIVRSALERIRQYLEGSSITILPADPSPAESGVLIAHNDQPSDEIQGQGQVQGTQVTVP